MKANTQFDFSGTRVLVTGGSNGIGFAIASAFQQAGADVTITGTRPNASDYDNDLSSFHYEQLQMEDTDAIYAFPEKLDGLDILVNNAGASLPGGKSEYEREVFEQSVQINLISAYHLSSACHPLLQASTIEGGASVVGIASLTSFLGQPIVPGYGAAKAGLVQLAKTLSMAWAEDPIRVNNVAAGFIATRMTEVVQQIPEMNDPIIERTPLSRWGQPGEIANAVLFLCSSQAGFITGQTLTVDGGYSIAG